MELKPSTEPDIIHRSVGLFLLAGIGRFATGLGFMPKNTLTPQGRPVGQDVSPTAVSARNNAGTVVHFETSVIEDHARFILGS